MRSQDEISKGMIETVRFLGLRDGCGYYGEVAPMNVMRAMLWRVGTQECEEMAEVLTMRIEWELGLLNLEGEQSRRGDLC